MNNQMQQFTSPEGHPITVRLEDDQPWFRTKEICQNLALGNVTEARRNLPDYNQQQLPVQMNTGVAGQVERDVWFVNEPGLYQLIFKSQKEEAKAFQRWVTEEVLPQIRKTGGYVMGEADLGLFVLECQGFGVTHYVDESNVYADFPAMKHALGYKRSIKDTLRSDLEPFMLSGAEVNPEFNTNEHWIKQSGQWITQSGLYEWAGRAPNAQPLLREYFDRLQQEVYQRRYQSAVESLQTTTDAGQGLTRADAEELFSEALDTKMTSMKDDIIGAVYNMMNQTDGPRKYVGWGTEDFVSHVEENFARSPSEIRARSLWEALFFRASYYYDIGSDNRSLTPESRVDDYIKWMRSLDRKDLVTVANISAELTNSIPAV